MRYRRGLVQVIRVAPVIALAAACASGLTPRQVVTWDAFKTCQPEGPSATFRKPLGLDGGWQLSGREGEVWRVHRCMQAYWDRAAREGRLPPLPPSLKVTRPAAPSGLVVSEPPTWTKGDEWQFRSETPRGESTLRWIVDREESIDGVSHYVIRSGKRERYYRKSDIAYSQDTMDGVVVRRNTPSRLNFVWPLYVGVTWEQGYRIEESAEGRTGDRIARAAVEAEEIITVPAGTFRTLKVVYRNKDTGASYWEEWYSPDVGM